MNSHIIVAKKFDFWCPCLWDKVEYPTIRHRVCSTMAPSLFMNAWLYAKRMKFQEITKKRCRKQLIERACIKEKRTLYNENKPFRISFPPKATCSVAGASSQCHRWTLPSTRRGPRHGCEVWCRSRDTSLEVFGIKMSVLIVVIRLNIRYEKFSN